MFQPSDMSAGMDSEVTKATRRLEALGEHLSPSGAVQAHDPFTNAARTAAGRSNGLEIASTSGRSGSSYERWVKDCHTHAPAS